ncbi:substrate-binding periplasmic protein [Ammoniphilus sp. 3BR4]|uniref:substrate-binding periplasmic protein n=1 Tax=Ammoniphilus sp. 3BR4 TaxID=3158265 RepID=UPI003467398C
MKRLLFFFLLLLVLVGCGKQETSTNTTITTNTNEKANTSANKTLVVGTTNASPPTAFVKAEDNQVNGIMVDMMKEAGKKAGYDVKYEAMSFSSLISALQNHRIDLISAGMSYNEERAKIVSFTDYVYGFHEALVVPKGSQVKSLEDLKGKKVGVAAGTIYVGFLEKSGIPMDVKVYEKTNQMLIELAQGRLDAMITDTPIVQYLMQQNPSNEVEIVKDYKPAFSLKMGFITNHDQEDLRNKLNKAISEMKKDGTLEQIYKKWGIQKPEFIK